MDEKLGPKRLNALRKMFESDTSKGTTDDNTPVGIQKSSPASRRQPATENKEKVHKFKLNPVLPRAKTPEEVKQTPASFSSKPAPPGKPAKQPKAPENTKISAVRKHAQLFDSQDVNKIDIPKKPTTPVSTSELETKVSARNVRGNAAFPEKRKDIDIKVPQNPFTKSKSSDSVVTGGGAVGRLKDLFDIGEKEQINSEPMNVKKPSVPDKDAALVRLRVQNHAEHSDQSPDENKRKSTDPFSPPVKPPRTFAHDIYHLSKLQPAEDTQKRNSTEENLGNEQRGMKTPDCDENFDNGAEIFGTVDFRIRGVLIEEDPLQLHYPRMKERVGSEASVMSDSSVHDYEIIELSPTNESNGDTPANLPKVSDRLSKSLEMLSPVRSRPKMPLPNSTPSRTRRATGPSPPPSNDLYEGYSVIRSVQARSWETPVNLNAQSKFSNSSVRSNSDECLYSKLHHSPTQPDYIDPADMFSRKPPAHAPGNPDIAFDEYGYALPHLHRKAKFAKSLDAEEKFEHIKFKLQPVPLRNPDQSAAAKGEKEQKHKGIKLKKNRESSYQEIILPSTKKDDQHRKSVEVLDIQKVFRRKAAVRQKIGQAFSILRKTRRRQTSEEDDEHDSVDQHEDDSESDDSESQIDIKELQRRIRHVTSIKEKHQPIYDRVRAFREKIYPQLFEYAVIVGLKMVDNRCKPVVLHKFPHHVDPEVTSIPEFCFPDKEELRPVTKYDSENFSFVLTSFDGSRDYGYCKRILPPGRGPRLPEVVCIVSPLGAHTLYTQVLDYAEKRRQVSSDYVMELIAAIYAKPLPSLGRSITVNSMNTQGALETLTLNRLEDTRLESVNFEYPFTCLGTENVLKVFASILLERRILFSASKLSTLSNCIHAIAGLLYPFQWQHTFIPVLPAALVEITCSPTPYIIGIMSPSLPKIDELPTEEVLIVDLDKGCLLCACDDETTIIPKKLQKALMSALTMAMEDSDGHKNVLISEAFVRVFVESIGHFEEHIYTQQDGKKFFQKESFCKAVTSKSLRMFLEWFCETQMFNMFINDQVEDVRKEKGLFDARITEYKQELASMPPTTMSNFRGLMKNLRKAFKTSTKGSGDPKKKAA